MSLWKFGGFEAEVDFTDADFLDRLFYAKKELQKEMGKVPKTGKISDAVRAQCACYYSFFDALFGDGAGEAMFEGKNSMSLCIEASEALAAIEDKQLNDYTQKASKYQVQQHGNRQQRRAQQKNSKKNFYVRK